MNAHGSVHKYGDHVDTDVIIPARYLNTQNARELADHCMEDIDKTFITRVQAGDIMVGGENFGCGSSREHAPLAIKCAGVSYVIAETFARIFYRNSINIGLLIIECVEAARGRRVVRHAAPGKRKGNQAGNDGKWPGGDLPDFDA